ncbi:MAG: glycosyltransferase family 2 protein [Odoribacter sp.]
MDIKEPFITVIVPCYNHEKYIVECLLSIHNQTYKKFQWIVVDDGSKDDCPNILKKYQVDFGYELILQENKGVAQTLTDTIKNYAKGKYISLCASDDFWIPQKLEWQLDFMECNPEYAMSYGRCFQIDSDSRRLPVIIDHKLRGGYIFEDIICQKFHPPVNYMIKRDVLAELGYFKNGVIAEDFYMNCMIASKYPIGFMDKYLAYYRVAPLATKRDPYTLLKSHRETIDMFKTYDIYAKAVYLSDLRCACLLSCYTKYKFMALKYAFADVKNIFHIYWWKAMINLLRRWIK